MERPKPIAAFDVDGTLYRSNLLEDLMYQLIRQGSFPKDVMERFRESQQGFKDVRDRKTYVQYMDQLIETYVHNLQGLPVNAVTEAAQKVIHFSTGLMYVHGRNLIKNLQETHKLVAISGSPIEVVAPFVAQLGIREVYATTFEVNKSLYTGEVIQVGTKRKGDTLQQKTEFLGATLDGSFAMGDTDSDIPMLDLVTKPVAFNPNKELFQHALNRGWEIVYERKDMILHLGQNGSFTVEDNFGHFRQTT